MGKKGRKKVWNLCLMTSSIACSSFLMLSVSLLFHLLLPTSHQQHAKVHWFLGFFFRARSCWVPSEFLTDRTISIRDVPLESPFFSLRLWRDKSVNFSIHCFSLTTLKSGPEKKVIKQFFFPYLLAYTIQSCSTRKHFSNRSESCQLFALLLTFIVRNGMFWYQ